MIERTFVQQGLRKIELEEYLKKEMERAGFTKTEIIKTPLVTRIVVNVTNPGLAIGKGGSNIKNLTNIIEKKFDIDNPQIEIRQIPIPEFDAQAQADKIKNLIERGINWRSISYKVVRDILKAGAVGVELILSGKLSGKGGRKRKQRIAEGYMKKVGHQVELVEYGKASAYPKAGAIGIKVRIVRPDTVFPDKVSLPELFEEEKEEEPLEVKEQEDKKEVKEEAEKEAEEGEKEEEKEESKESNEPQDRRKRMSRRELQKEFEEVKKAAEDFKKK